MKECSVCKHCFPDEYNNCPDDGGSLTPSIAGDTTLDGRYKLEKRLGQGGMGIVFKARHNFLKTSYAIKVILPDLVGNDPMLITRFRQEAMVAARIGHKNIVNVTDFGVAGGKMPYLVMDLINGQSLHDLLIFEGRFSAERAMEIMSALCAGIGAAHKQGIVHRDLKPLNVMVQHGKPINDAVKVLDFGLAKIKSGELLGSFIAAQTTGLMGSPYYMAPEQWSDDEPDARADIYSLGVILFQMLSGDVPFKGSTIPAIMKKHLTDPPPPFATRGINVAPPIEEVVRHALAKARDDRISSVEELMRDLYAAASMAYDSLGRTQAGQINRPNESETMTFLKSDPIVRDSYSATDAIGEATSISESQKRIEDEADRLTREFEEAQRRADEARTRAEEASRKRAEEEALRRRAEEEAARKLAEEEAARQLAEEIARKNAEEEAARQRAEEEAARRLAEEAERQRAEEEAARQRIAEEATRLAREVVEAQQRAEEARLRAEDEARKRTEEAAARKRAEEEAHRLALEVAEAQRRAEEARVRAELENQRRSEEEVKRRLEDEEEERQRAEESERILLEEETARKRADEQADRLGREVLEAQRRAEDARTRAEEEAQKRLEAEGALKRAEEEARKLLIQVAEVQKRAEERKRADEEERKAEFEARLRAASLAEKSRPGDKYEPVAVAEHEGDDATIVSTPGSTPPAFDVDDLQRQATLDRAIREIDFSETKRQPSLSTQQLGETSWQKSNAALESSDAGVPKRAFTGVIVLGVIALLMLVVVGGGAALYFSDFFGKSTGQQQSNTPAKSPTQETPVAPPKTEIVKVDGGKYMMGLKNVLSNSSYDQAQYPAHQVNVKSFWMDKTEVTNAEYAEFVSATKYAPPSYWRGGKPPSGQDQWPVTNVSISDATAFAAWRGKRDGQRYRLPREDEWEYAARNGAQATIYPWGNEWLDDRANVDANSLKAVGSYPLGAASRWGVMDLIGNVWEWTSTPATPYPGNTTLTIEKGQTIIRGGAYVENARGATAITSTSRSWVPPTAKEAPIGFRLVRDP